MDYSHALRSSFFDITAVADTPDDIARHARYIEDGLLFIGGGHILALMSWEEGQHHLRHMADWLDYRGRIIVPGFVDTHLHYPQTGTIGAYGEQLLAWLTAYTFPAESEYACPEHAAQMSDFFLSQLLCNGTTTAMVFGTVHPQSVDALFTAAERLSMRLIAGKVMMDQNAPEDLIESAEQSARDTRALIRRWHNRGRLGYAITPRFAPTSSPRLLEAVRALRAEFPDTWLQTHLSENAEEIAWVKSLWPEQDTYLDVYHHYGLTGERSVFAHAIHLHDSEWDCLRRTRSAVAFCPTSNLFLGSGLFPLRTSWQKRVKVGIGTDVGAGTTFNMLRTLGEAYKICQLQSYSLCASEALYHATLGGARALCLDDRIGNFMPGKEADFAVLDPAATPLQALRISRCRDIHEQLFALITLGDDRSIHQTWIDGRCAWDRTRKEAAA